MPASVTMVNVTNPVMMVEHALILMNARTLEDAHQFAYHVTDKGGAEGENIPDGNGYICNCDDGHYLDGTVCKDINKCDDGSEKCDADQGTGHNDVETYSCTRDDDGDLCRCER